ncbi:MAG TPA: hypothetical protein VGH86_15675 [Phenylobacterium sp.]|jgi:hypothetical protein
MDIHKPKPWHGVREFLKEYLIIVVGVLTALSAEAGVEWLHWRHQTDVARRELAFDMKRMMAWAGAMDAQAPCVGARLAEIDAILDGAQATGRLPTMGMVRMPRQGAWAMRSWSNLTYGQTLAHMSNREQISLSALALQVQSMHDAEPQFSAHWSVLKTLTGPGRRIDTPEIVTLRAAVVASRSFAGGLRNGAIRAETFVIQSGLLSRPEWEDAWRQGVDAASQAPDSRAFCQPIPSRFEGRDDARLAAPITVPGTARMDDIGIRGESLK